MDFRKQWDQWGWLIPALIIVLGAARLAFGREPFCGPVAEHCLREWMSAMGGWAAVAAAAPTIYYLSRQIRSAANHQRVNFAITVRSSIALAVVAKQAAVELGVQIDRIRHKLGEKNHERGDQLGHMVAIFEIAGETLRRAYFTEFESRIGLPTELTTANLVVILDQMADRARQIHQTTVHQLTEAEFAAAMASLHGTLDIAENYAVNVRVASDGFLAQMATLDARID